MQGQKINQSVCLGGGIAENVLIHLVVIADALASISSEGCIIPPASASGTISTVGFNFISAARDHNSP